jgi:hypothetical protein
MKIADPVLTVDVSDWVDHINTRELEDGGVVSVIVGMYFNLVKGKWVLSPVSRKHCEAVAKSSMILQAYAWDDITLPAKDQALRYCDMLAAEGLPIKWTWADDEQWWAAWGPWYEARESGDYSQVPIANPSLLSQHMRIFVETIHGRVPQIGVYTNKAFVHEHAPGMDAWLPNYLSWVPQYGKQPAQKIRMSWDELKAHWLPDYDIILSAGQFPNNVRGHQFTGERCLLPGSYNVWGIRQLMDVSVFERSFIDALRGSVAPVPTPPPVTTGDKYRMIRGAWAYPDATGRSRSTRHINFGEIVTVVEFPGEWAKLAEGDYVYRVLLEKV